MSAQTEWERAQERLPGGPGDDDDEDVPNCADENGANGECPRGEAMTTKNATISVGPDNGFGMFNLYSGHENICSTNDIEKWLNAIRAFATSEPWEPERGDDV